MIQFPHTHIPDAPPGPDPAREREPEEDEPSDEELVRRLLAVPGALAISSAFDRGYALGLRQGRENALREQADARLKPDSPLLALLPLLLLFLAGCSTLRNLNVF